MRADATKCNMHAHESMQPQSCPQHSQCLPYDASVAAPPTSCAVSTARLAPGRLARPHLGHGLRTHSRHPCQTSRGTLCGRRGSPITRTRPHTPAASSSQLNLKLNWHTLSSSRPPAVPQCHCKLWGYQGAHVPHVVALICCLRKQRRQRSPLAQQGRPISPYPSASASQ